MKLDMKQRKTLARVDNDARRTKIEIAREVIYKRNYAVDSKTLDPILKPQSLVPTSVSFGRVCVLMLGLISVIECIFKEARTTWFRPLPHACCRSHARV
jgi:hypothetical protein